MESWKIRYERYLTLLNHQEISQWLLEERSRIFKELDFLAIESKEFEDKSRIISYINLVAPKDFLLTESINMSNDKREKHALMEKLMEDKIDEVIKILVKKSKNDEDIANNISLQANRWSTLKNNILGNLIPHTDISIEKNRIVVALYEIILTQ